ncbi:TonB-dependent receptor plug domain-containing protein [Pseudobacteriovorax antillogorgiicola]|uniref:Outer membrane transport energization protein TonB n=1 Tax=Pseudobacteriovorax antillogorgiicola TaxID=1513793 RepID=A0A1Y6CQA6_9BACT|nr:TonB-dependent receptor plug domain-containing protein [Pseudobacteriovorax antillogorgiicola]TCS42119.1 outer membrane transport energization protein TonB [Pseudobacteriovorax antillogorgiicola]SMF83015.1 outer membrane transport energization protein TonB [Pseudobacteriovorax antillogorgiicola]
MKNPLTAPSIPLVCLVATLYHTTAKSEETESQETKSEVERMSVSGTRVQKTEAEEVSKIEIRAEEAELVAPSGDVAQVPKLFPGTVARPQDSEVSIRGSDKNDTLYFIDDLQAPNLFEPISGTSVIPSKAIDTLTFVPGNFDSEYGNSTAGVIKLETRGEAIVEPYSEFRLNTPIYVSAYHEQALGQNSSMIASARKSILEPFVNAAPLDEGTVLLPYFQDAYLQHFYGDDKISIKSRYVHSRSGAEVKVFTDRSQETDGTSEFNFANGYDLFGFDIQTSIGSANVEVDPYFSSSGTEFSVGDIFFNIDVNTITVPIRSQIQLADRINLYLGVQTIYRDFVLDAQVPDTTQQGPFSDPETAPKIALNVDASQREDAAWASFEFGVGRFILTPSFRLFSQTNIDKGGVDPRFVGRVFLTDTQTAKFGVGRYSQSPGPEQLDPDYGNENLGWIRSTHYSVGLESIVSNYWTSDFQIFYKEWDDDILDDPVNRFIADTTRNSQGLEWFFRYGDGSDLFGWLSYTYSETKEIRGEGAKEIFSDTDSTHVLHLVANYKLSPTFQLGGRFKHQTGYVYTPIDTVWYQANVDTYLPEENPELVNSERVPDTTSVSVFAQQTFEYTSWDLVLRYGFEEYQFRKSSPNIQYNYDYTKKEYTAGLPVIPFIEVRAIL